MDDIIIPCYCLCDDILKGIGHRDDPQCRITDAEVLTIALVAARFFSGTIALSVIFLAEKGYLPQISASRYNRRLHRAKDLLLLVFVVLAQ